MSVAAANPLSSTWQRWSEYVRHRAETELEPDSSSFRTLCSIRERLCEPGVSYVAEHRSMEDAAQTAILTPFFLSAAATVLCICSNTVEERKLYNWICGERPHDLLRSRGILSNDVVTQQYGPTPRARGECWTKTKYDFKKEHGSDMVVNHDNLGFVEMEVCCMRDFYEVLPIGRRSSVIILFGRKVTDEIIARAKLSFSSSAPLLVCTWTTPAAALVRVSGKKRGRS
jgi:hypothetical protein